VVGPVQHQRVEAHAEDSKADNVEEAEADPLDASVHVEGLEVHVTNAHAIVIELIVA